jgi:tripartite-type tricarboxylate transporter receptor subunit TctC
MDRQGHAGMRDRPWSCIRSGLFAIAAALAPTPGHAQEWPARPVHFIVPFAAGGATDLLTRLLCQQLALQLDAPFVVDNRGGAGGNIGAAAVAASAPDGYTLLMSAPGVLSYNKSLYREMSFDPDRDLEAVSLFAVLPNVLVVHPSVPAHSVAELIAYAKADPGRLNYGSAGIGSTSHIAAELFKSMAEVSIQHVAYRGTGLSLIDLVAGRVQLVIDNLPPIVPLIRSNQVRALAVSTERRSPLLPELPTISESGLPGFAAYSWQMVAAPAGTPKSITDKLAAAIKRISTDSRFRERVAEMGAETVGDTPAQAREFVKQESVKWRAVVDKSGARAD